MSVERYNPKELMDSATVAELLGVSSRQLNNYLNKNGLPSQGRGRERFFIWSEVREWYIGYRLQMEMGDGNDGNEDADLGDPTSESGGNGKADVRALNRRKLSAEAQLKEIALAKEQGKVISIGDAAEKLNRMFGNMRAQLLGMAPKLAGRLEAARDRTDREAALKEELENLCRDLSAGKIIDLPAEVDQDPDTLELTAAADPAFAYGEPDAVQP